MNSFEIKEVLQFRFTYEQYRAKLCLQSKISHKKLFEIIWPQGPNFCRATLRKYFWKKEKMRLDTICRKSPSKIDFHKYPSIKVECFANEDEWFHFIRFPIYFHSTYGTKVITSSFSVCFVQKKAWKLFSLIFF